MRLEYSESNIKTPEANLGIDVKQLQQCQLSIEKCKIRRSHNRILGCRMNALSAHWARAKINGVGGQARGPSTLPNVATVPSKTRTSQIYSLNFVKWRH
jgi:hypothetical protein